MYFESQILYRAIYFCSYATNGSVLEPDLLVITGGSGINQKIYKIKFIIPIRKTKVGFDRANLIFQLISYHLSEFSSWSFDNVYTYKFLLLTLKLLFL